MLTWSQCKIIEQCIYLRCMNPDATSFEVVLPCCSATTGSKPRPGGIQVIAITKVLFYLIRTSVALLRFSHAAPTRMMTLAYVFQPSIVMQLSGSCASRICRTQNLCQQSYFLRAHRQCLRSMSASKAALPCEEDSSSCLHYVWLVPLPVSRSSHSRRAISVNAPSSSCVSLPRNAASGARFQRSAQRSVT